ncbi:terminase [Bacillus pseudomycoides]|uniref:phage terminase small subunit n=1 Tax=Bacillus pseudomycoides TaxID=64104 RepID=UPI000BFBC3D6|nr:phage terminase small subunit [Bacillus pseudomycoides]PHB11480.1 terminase [Bacillus pseudomycoides]
MAKVRSPNRDKAFEVFKEHNGDITNRKIAEMLQEQEKTISSWKSRDKWVAKLNGSDCSTTIENECSTAQKKRSTSQKLSDALKGNQNAVGNKGGAPKGNSNAVGFGAPKQNANAVTHGLFRKIIPNDDQHAMELLDEIQNHTELDMLFNSIQLQYFNILNSQRIMHVRDKDDMSREVISESEAGESYTVQFAWDKQANLLTAYARAMTTLSSMIERFDKLANVDDERRLKLVQMKTNIEKTQADTDFAQERAAKLKGQKKDTSLLDALIEGRKQYEQNSD